MKNENPNQTVLEQRQEQIQEALPEQIMTEPERPSSLEGKPAPAITDISIELSKKQVELNEVQGKLEGYAHLVERK